MQFKQISTAVAKQFQSMTTSDLFLVDVDKDTLWNTYLGSFPEGSNPIYKVRAEHDCSCCKSFVRTLGAVVSITDGRLLSIWDVKIDGPYQAVVDAMSALVKAAAIDNLFLHTEKIVGTANNRQLLEDKTVKTWEHFFVNLPTDAVMKGDLIGPKLSDARATHDVMLRGLKEITLDAVDTVLELIGQNSLYRGEENSNSIAGFRKLKVAFEKLTIDRDRDVFAWSNVGTPAPISRIRGTAIGTLLTDLSEGTELEDAVRKFEAMVAPTNYKRPTALITKSMIADAQAKIVELGLSSALERRYATIEDITVNNILFVDRETKKEMNVFEQLASTTPEKTKNLDKVEEIGIADFLTKILPKAESIEVLFENRHAGQMVSLIAPVDPTAKQLFKWPNHFSWSYTGELTDSIKERVKAAGGRIDADFRSSLSWHNHDDLDLHLVEPDGNRIFFRSKVSPRTGGQLDVDMNAGSGTTRNAVENIFYAKKATMLEGNYQLFVHNFAKREAVDVGFEAEIEFDGTVYSFAYPKPVKDQEAITVATFKYTKKDGLVIIQSLPSTQTSKTVWNLATQTYQKVKVLMLSPNHWDGHGVGNKHYFFMLEDAANETKARGFFNEFLTEDLSKHRKVFEVVGAKMKTDESDRQLSGIGFSSTQRNHVLVRVKGSFTRTIKLVF